MSEEHSDDDNNGNDDVEDNDNDGGDSDSNADSVGITFTEIYHEGVSIKPRRLESGDAETTSLILSCEPPSQDQQ